MPALMAESDSLRESMEYARSVNAAVGDDGASAVAMMNDAIGRVSLGFEGMWNTVAIELAPAVEMVATAITGWLPSIVDLVETYLPAAIDGFVFMADSIYEAAEIIGLAAKREETFAQAIERTRQAAQDRAAEMEADRLANKEASKWAAEQEAAKKAADAEAKQREKEAKDLEAANKKKEDQAKAEQTRIDNLIKREEDRLKIRELELTQGKEAARVWDLTNQGVDEATAKRLVAQENSLARGNISQQINAATQGRLITRGTSDLMPKLVALAEKQTKAAENSEKSLADIYEEQKRNKPTQNVASGV
jgi:hypothetical protein